MRWSDYKKVEDNPMRKDWTREGRSSPVARRRIRLDRIVRRVTNGIKRREIRKPQQQHDLPIAIRRPRREIRKPARFEDMVAYAFPMVV